MGTTETRGKNRPVFCPANAMFDTHPDRTQLLVERFLLVGQFAAARFLEGRVDGQAWYLLLYPGFDIPNAYLGYLLG